MNQKIVSIAFVLLAIFFLTHTKVVQAATGLNIGDTAPNFILKDLSGKKVQLSDFKGKSVMINFWATRCPPCKKEMLDIETFSKEYKDQWVVLAVNVDGGNEEGVRQFIQERKLTFPVIMDEKMWWLINIIYLVFQQRTFLIRMVSSLIRRILC